MALLEKAAGQGHAYAMNELGSVHLEWEDYERAVEWFTNGAEAFAGCNVEPWVQTRPGGGRGGARPPSGGRLVQARGRRRFRGGRVQSPLHVHCRPRWGLADSAHLLRIHILVSRVKWRHMTWRAISTRPLGAA